MQVKEKLFSQGVLLVVMLMFFGLAGCTSFSKTIHTVEVSPIATSPIPLKVGIREAEVEGVGAGVFLLASQPAVKKALKDTEQVRIDFTKAFEDYCTEANLFEECVGDNFIISEVDLELRPRLKRLESNANAIGWMLANMATLYVPALFGWPYQNDADCIVEVDVTSADGKFTKTYFGTAQGNKSTNFYALMFGLREVPHAMLAINRCITLSFDGAARQMIDDREDLILNRAEVKPE